MSGQPDSGGSVRSYVRFLREHWLVIVITTILAAGLGFAISSQQRPKYRTSLQILFRETTIGQQVAGVPIFENPQANSSAGSEMTTNVTLLGSETVARSVMRQLNLDTDVQALLDRVSVRQVGLSNIGEITVTADQPREAQRIADAWGEAFIGQRRVADQTKLGDAIGLLRQRLDATPPADLASDVARQTSEQLQRLELLKSVQDGNAEVVLPAGLPDAPYSPRTKRTAVIAALLGALLGVGLAALRRALDRRVTDPDDVGEMLGIPVLAEVSVAAFGDVEAFVLADDTKGDVWRSTEEFRTLATNLRYIGDVQHRRSIAVTSAVPDEGKTTIASNLAITLARMGRSTALIDGDLRRGRIHTLFGIDPNAGVSTLAAGLSEARNTWARIPVEPATSDLAVMAAGPPPPDPVQILESAAVGNLVRKARESFDCVLVDTPPVLVVSDALAISRRVDAVLVVVRLGRTTRDQIQRLSTALDRIGVRPIGVVVTGVKRRAAYYSNAYEYSAGAQPAGVEVESSPRV